MTLEENNIKLAEIEKILDDMKFNNSTTRMPEVLSKLEPVMIYVAIVIEDPAKAKKLEEEARARGEQLQLTPDIKTRPLLVTTQKGENYIALYTNPSQIPDKVQKNGIITMPFTHAIKFAAQSNGKILGAVINPFSHNVVLSTAKQDKSNVNIHALARKNVEYVLLPRSIYEKGKEYFDSVNSELLFGLFKDQYLENRSDNPYKESDFDVMSFGIRADMDLISIEMPTKNLDTGACIHIYITYNTEKNEAGYYMIVKQGGPNKLWFIDSKGQMSDLGDAPAEGTELNTILEKEDERLNG